MSGLPVAVIGEWYPCPYLNPWPFSLYFFPLSCYTWSDRVAWWAPGGQPRSTQHTELL